MNAELETEIIKVIKNCDVKYNELRGNYIYTVHDATGMKIIEVCGGPGFDLQTVRVNGQVVGSYRFTVDACIPPVILQESRSVRNITMACQARYRELEKMKKNKESTENADQIALAFLRSRVKTK